MVVIATQLGRLDAGFDRYSQAIRGCICPPDVGHAQGGEGVEIGERKSGRRRLRKKMVVIPAAVLCILMCTTLQVTADT